MKRSLPWMLVLSIAWLMLAADRIAAQFFGAGLPTARLMTVYPSGGKAGTTVDGTFTGFDLEEPKYLLFSHPGIRAEVTITLPPPPDPKAPPQNPPPQPRVSFRATIAADVPPGTYDVRFVGKYGISNPRTFVVGDLNEVVEKEPNNDVPQAHRVELNTTINGAMANATDVDYFVFAGKKGQRVLLSCLSTSIDSRMHPLVTLYDAKDKKLAESRAYYRNDALADCTLPEDGDYTVRVCEFTHTQGNPEYFYRLTISTTPWIDAVYPPMIEPGKTSQVTIYGRNLPGGKPDPSLRTDDGQPIETLVTDIKAPDDPTALAFQGHLRPCSVLLDGFEHRLRNPSGLSNAAFFTFARSPVVMENDVNDSADKAQEVPIPCEIAGRMNKPRDRDWYAFTAKAGTVLSIELFADRLRMPGDYRATVRRRDNKQVLVELDDENNSIQGFQFPSRTSDPPRYRFQAPADGVYEILVDCIDEPACRHIYRLSIAPERPDYRLAVMPSLDVLPGPCNLPAGGQQLMTVFAGRRDGFNGPITVTAENLPPGVTCQPQILGPGMNLVRLVFSANADAPQGYYEIRVKGSAQVDGKPVDRIARNVGIVWPTFPDPNNPAFVRPEKNLMLTVDAQAPYRLEASIDKAVLVQGEKATIKVKLHRQWADFKGPVQILPPDLPPNLLVNNNQPIQINPDQTEGSMVVDVRPNVNPGTYSLVFRGLAFFQYSKDPKARQKPNIVVALPPLPVQVTVLPKQVATVAVATPNVKAKVGTQTEVVVKVQRINEFAGELKVNVIVPQNVKGVTVDEVIVPAGQNEVKCLLRIASDMPAGKVNDIVVRAVAMMAGNVPIAQETKFSIQVEP